MTKKQRVFSLAAVGIVAIAAVIILVVGPNLGKKTDQMTGTITQAERYRSGQMTAKDVVLTKEDVIKFLQSPYIQNVLRSVSFQKLMADPSFAALMQNASFAALLQDPNFAGLLQNAQFAGLLQNGRFAGLLQNGQFAGLLQNA